MHTVWIALIIAGVVGIGIYLAVSDLTQQYALDTSGSYASGAVCIPDRPSVRPNQSVSLRLSGIPEGTVIAWSTPEGVGRTMPDGTFSISYPSVGSKSAAAFIQDGARWYRVPCTVLVR